MRGKQEWRKELGLIAAFHPKVMVVQTAAGAAGAFPQERAGGADQQLECRSSSMSTPPARANKASATLSPASMQGWRSKAGSTRSSSTIHDNGTHLRDRFSLDGNPDVDAGLDAANARIRGRGWRGADHGHAIDAGALRP